MASNSTWVMKLTKKSQSAMEYLMTYGWAILIIAIVLVALFQLGIFNANSFAPRAQPGACQVFKTGASSSLEGECNNMLPQYVALFNGNILGYSSITAPNQNHISSVTVTAWVYDTNLTYTANGRGSVVYTGAPGGTSFFIAIFTGGTMEWLLWTGTWTGAYTTTAINADTWYFLAGTYDGNTISYYINGKYNTGGCCYNAPLVYSPTKISIGNTWPYAGEIANIQIYNTSLSANDIAALYNEGIGGTPIDQYNLVDWYPLNGNANDYSGNNNNGAASNVVYVNNWVSSYTAP